MSKPWFMKGASTIQARNCLGEEIYPRIYKIHPKFAGKITGMILEAKTVVECDALLDDESAFNELVKEAIEILEKHVTAS